MKSKKQAQNMARVSVRVSQLTKVLPHIGAAAKTQNNSWSSSLAAAYTAPHDTRCQNSCLQPEPLGKIASPKYMVASCGCLKGQGWDSTY